MFESAAIFKAFFSCLIAQNYCAGAVIDPTSGNVFVATVMAPYDGKTDWGDSVIELNPDATRVLGNYTPADNFKLK